MPSTQSTAGRLLHLGAVLKDDWVTLEQAAVELGFGSASAVAHFIRRVTGRTGAAFREEGAITAATAHWTSRGQIGKEA
jgi:methylphosphotriester-DNA--protein-cysteine methyltransferase